MSNPLFDSFDLSPELHRAIEDMNYTESTAIQAQAIPLILSGKDVIGRSSTGTGKTAAFGLPAVELVAASGSKKPQVLVLSPTRELAMQITEEMRKYSKYKQGVSIACVYGGAPMDNQIRQLKTANIVIGTPGRLMDHMRRKTLKLDELKMVILDEADEMLNMGFLEDIQTILTETPEDRQTILFSATMPPAILKITKQFQTDPEMVDIQSSQRTISTIQQYYYQVPQARKMDAINLLLQFNDCKRSVIFCNTKKMVDDMVEYLNDRGFKSAGLHGDMKQSARSQVMQSFRDGKIHVLVATDVAARGIDVENIEAVFNYDIPQEFEYYIHRIGRTGRAGKEGSSHTLVCNYKQVGTIKELKRFINAEIIESPLPSPESIMHKRREKFISKIEKCLALEEYQSWGETVEQIAQQGYEPKDIACALLQMMSAKDKKLVPAFKGPVAANRTDRRGGKRVVLNVDIGRSQRIGPNFIVGAIVDATGLPSRSIGKIDIFDHHSVVEMFENDALTVLENMENATIKGQPVTFTLSGVKPKALYKQGNRHEGKHGANRPAFREKNSRSSYREGKPSRKRSNVAV
ncbi:DEAD/DEAH box helicase [Youxingia wuxianensis]|uniref:RNA helicase n=1 Tax=Youxingia wuxianensis TaxID=2763678 RepID=A0A926ENC6_9FIRM|nr:DEAD/DEAH box helicase [Youxingia wuxianensis]MBC8584402.1 DEAD/DEAH box helicase [Youxingia wuxianensis]